MIEYIPHTNPDAVGCLVSEIRYWTHTHECFMGRGIGLSRLFLMLTDPSTRHTWMDRVADGSPDAVNVNRPVFRFFKGDWSAVLDPRDASQSLSAILKPTERLMAVIGRIGDDAGLAVTLDPPGTDTERIPIRVTIASPSPRWPDVLPRPERIVMPCDVCGTVMPRERMTDVAHHDELDGPGSVCDWCV